MNEMCADFETPGIDDMSVIIFVHLSNLQKVFW